MLPAWWSLLRALLAALIWPFGLVRCVLLGAFDSVSMWRSYPLVVHSDEVRAVLSQCLLLNGVLLGGSLALYFGLVRPCVVWLVDDGILTWGLDLLFDWLWCWPTYAIAIVFNTIWYQDMFNALRQALAKPVPTQQFHQHPQPITLANAAVKNAHDDTRVIAGAGGAAVSAVGLLGAGVVESVLVGLRRFSMAVAEEVVRVMVVLVATAAAIGLKWIVHWVGIRCLAATIGPDRAESSAVPGFVSASVYFACISSIHSFHAFDYLWCALPLPRPSRDLAAERAPVSRNIPNLGQKIDFLDGHWLYFAGFGWSLALILVFLPRFAAAATYAVIFPILVLMTFTSRPSSAPNPIAIPCFRPLYLAITSTLALCHKP
jgi:hypothetical protein